MMDKLADGWIFDMETASFLATDHATGDRDKTETKAVAVVPEKSDNAVTTSLNQWAADTYPVAYAHLQAAKDMRDGLKKRSTD